jgi:hypothetical protein
MAQISCVCEGSNENCSHCFGRGFIEVRSMPARRESKPLNSASEDRAAKFIAKYPQLNPNPLRQPEGIESRRRAPAPHATFADENPTTRDAERSLTSAALKNARPSLLRAGQHRGGRVDVLKITKDLGTSICPSCRASFSHFINLVAHQQAGCRRSKTPSKQLVEVQALPRDKVTRKPTRLIACSHCGCPVKVTNIGRHLGRCPKYSKSIGSNSSQLHRQERPADKPAHPKVFHSIAEAKRADPRSSFAQANSIDRIDATRPYAHSFRENGKYGSHPLHDGMDDESGPD